MIHNSKSIYAKSADSLLYKVYAYMAGALLITALVAYSIAMQPRILSLLLTNRWLVLGLFIIQLTLVITLSTAIARLSFFVALLLLLLYACLTGITFSTLFVLYTQTFIYTSFFVTSSMFATLAVYGYYTKTDLTRIGNYALIALFGLIVGFIINLFFANSSFDYILTIMGVLLFSALTAYDVQKIRRLNKELFNQQEAENKIAVLGALTLYLDFINLFLLILRLGSRRNNQ